MTARDLPFISIVVPVRNEAKSLPGLLHSLALQEYPSSKFEVIIADGCSTDDTRRSIAMIARKMPMAVRVVDNPGIRSSAGRNAGLGAALGDIIVFIDGHCVLPSNYLLQNTVEILDTTGADCLCRPQPLLAPVTAKFGEVVAHARASWFGHGRDSLIYDMSYSGFADPTTSGATYRRYVFEKLGAYDESFDACEDCEFNLRARKAGFLAYTDPKLAVYYEPRSTVKGLWRQMIRYGRGRVKLMCKHPDYFSMSQAAPLLLLIDLCTAPLCFLLPGWLRLLVLLPLSIFVICVFVASLQLTSKHGLRYLLEAPVAFGCIYLGLGAGILLEILQIKD